MTSRHNARQPDASASEPAQPRSLERNGSVSSDDGSATYAARRMMADKTEDGTIFWIEEWRRRIRRNRALERDAICENCNHWEPDKTGLKPYRRGYCPVFDKTTDAIHGSVCTAHEMNTLNNLDQQPGPKETP